MRLVKGLKKQEQNIFALANAISFSLSPILLNYLFIRYLAGNAVNEAIFMLTLINTIALTLFLSIDLLLPKYLLDKNYSRSAIFLFSLKTNLLFATLTLFITSIGLALEKSASINFFATFLYIFAMAFFYTCRSVLGGSNQFSRAFYLTSFDFLASLCLVAATISIGKVYFWTILASFAIARIFATALWWGWFYRKEKISRRNDFGKQLLLNKKLVKNIINLVIVGAGLQILNNLPILLVAKSSISESYIIQIIVLIQIFRGLIGLLSGFVSRSLNILNEINLRISDFTHKQVLTSNIKIISVAFLVLFSIFLWKGNDIVGVYTSQNVKLSIMIMTLVLFNESLLYIFGILRLILISIGRIFILNMVIGLTVLSLIFLWLFLNQSNLGILYSVAISTLLGLTGLYFFGLLSKRLDRN